MSEKRYKIFVNRLHFASVREDLLIEFRRKKGILKFQPWLKEIIFQEFGIHLHDKKSIEELNEVLDALYYDDVGEWLQEYMRREV